MVCAGLELLGGYQGLHRQLMSARSSQEADASQSEALKEACECLGSWRRLLISQLPDIYPITQVRLTETVLKHPTHTYNYCMYFHCTM